MSMEGGASGSSAVADAAMAVAGAVDPDLALGVFFSTFSCLQTMLWYLLDCLCFLLQ
jgi:hypothetical protein